MSSVLIIGGGAAGMMAGIIAARGGHKVTILEKNEKCGKKVFITGKGRCNLTNAGEPDDILNSIVTNKKFMYSSLKQFGNYDVMGFFDELGLPLKVERGNRVFPESDKSSDVIACLVKELARLCADIRYHTAVKEVVTKNGAFSHVVDEHGKIWKADCLIVATGGKSYPSTGSTGDGYAFAKEMGHTIVKTTPALVPFNAKEEYVKELQGLSLRNVAVSIEDDGKEVYSDFGELLFTHFGVSGPTIISASSMVTDRIAKRPLKLFIDLKPALSGEQLDDRILRDFGENRNKALKNALDNLYPKKLIPVMIDLSRIDGNKKVNEIAKAERERLLHFTKRFPVTLTGLRGFNEAIITQGGVSVKEIYPATMESKLVRRVFFAGEVLDVDAVTGGFNLQVAWSTAYAAASGIQ